LFADLREELNGFTRRQLQAAQDNRERLIHSSG
jgi:hypothetical protein